MTTNPTTLPLFDFEPDWSPGLKCSMRYPSNLAASPHGDEQRELLSSAPIRRIVVPVSAETMTESRRLRQFLRDNIGRKIIVPLWGDAVRVTAAASGSAITVEATQLREFPDSGWMVIWNMSDGVILRELFRIASTTSTQINVSGSALSRAYPAGSLVAPVMAARINGNSTASQWAHSDLASASVEFAECIEEAGAYSPIVPATFIWNPMDIAGAKKLWLDDSRLVGMDGDTIAQWRDRSGGDYHVAQSTANAKPLVKTNILGSRSVARFDGSNDYLAASANMNWIQSMMIVGKRAEPDNEMGEFGDDKYRGFFSNNAGEWTWFTNHWLDGTVCDPNFIMSHYSVIVGNVRQSAAYYSYFRVGFGSGGKPFLNGDIACIVASDTALSDSDRQKLEGWGAWTYGLQSYLPGDHPYKTVSP